MKKHHCKHQQAVGNNANTEAPRIKRNFGNLPHFLPILLLLGDWQNHLSNRRLSDLLSIYVQKRSAALNST